MNNNKTYHNFEPGDLFEVGLPWGGARLFQFCLATDNNRFQAQTVILELNSKNIGLVTIHPTWSRAWIKYE